MLRLAGIALTVFSFLAPTPASAQVTLKFKYDTPGEYSVETVSRMNQTLTLSGMDLETGVESTERRKMSYGKRDGEGNVLLSVKTERVQTKMSLPGDLTIEFDSEADDESDDDPNLAPLFALLRASAKLDVTFAMDDDAQIKSAAGVDKLLEKVPAELRRLLGDQFSEKSLIRNLQQQLDAVPKNAVKPGDFWDRSFVLDAGSGQLLTFQRRYEYVGTVEEDGKTLDKLGITDTDIDFSIAENSPLPIKLKESDLEIESSQGEMLFDRELGRDVKNSLKTRLTGSLTFEANGQELPAELDLSIDITSAEVK